MINNLYIFSCIDKPSICLLWKKLFRFSAHFFIWLFAFLILSCMTYVIWISTPCWSHANIFSHYVGYLFIFLVGCFAMQKLLSLTWLNGTNKVPFVYFSFCFFCLSGQIQKTITVNNVKSILPMFFSRSFMVSDLTFKSLIHFEFIFVYSVREYSNFILLHVAVQFSKHNLLKRLSFLHCIFLPLLS